MKKKRIASLLLLAPLALLGACSTTPTTALEANWFSSTSMKIIPDDFEETLVYDVSFTQSSSAKNGRFKMNYPNGGTYTVTFSSGATEDGRKTYVYKTELKMQVEYILNGISSGPIDDVVTTYVEFLDSSNALKPLKSQREVHSSAPVVTPASPASTLSKCYVTMDYKAAISYNHDKDQARYSFINLASNATEANFESKTIKLKGKGLFFDNEQLIPLLRAADLSSNMVLRTIDPTTNTLEKIAIKDGPTGTTVTQSIKRNTDQETEPETIKATEISIAYNKRNSGGTHKFTLAKRESRDNNKWRNVCLKYEYPVIYSHGTMTYRLVSANFYK